MQIICKPFFRVAEIENILLSQQRSMKSNSRLKVSYPGPWIPDPNFIFSLVHWSFPISMIRFTVVSLSKIKIIPNIWFIIWTGEIENTPRSPLLKDQQHSGKYPPWLSHARLKTGRIVDIWGVFRLEFIRWPSTLHMYPQKGLYSRATGNFVSDSDKLSRKWRYSQWSSIHWWTIRSNRTSRVYKNK